jgi:hypothetical protein
MWPPTEHDDKKENYGVQVHFKMLVYLHVWYFFVLGQSYCYCLPNHILKSLCHNCKKIGHIANECCNELNLVQKWGVGH